MTDTAKKVLVPTLELGATQVREDYIACEISITQEILFKLCPDLYAISHAMRAISGTCGIYVSCRVAIYDESVCDESIIGARLAEDDAAIYEE